MGLGLTDGFVRLVRAALGLSADSGEPPSLFHVGLYPANVDACASDGSTCDVTPADKRISPEKNVKVRVGIPGAVAIVSPGATVLLSWERGDPSKPYCMPAWGSGATVTELTLKAALVYIADKSGANFVALANLVDTELGKISTTLGSLTGGGGSAATFGTAYTRASTAASKTKAV